MKIIFICGSLEPGRDGVGDYTRRLAGELIWHGHQAAAVALNDGYLTHEFAGTQEADRTDLPVFRVPSIWPAKQRAGRVKEWIKAFDPEWLSLQFVPFSFHPKGISLGLNRLLENLGEGRRWNIMFHELWVGMEVGSSKKHVWWGWLQRQLIQSLILKLKPCVIHTQTHLYQAQLARLGIDAKYLPLFSNIPLVSKAGCSFAEAGKQITLVLFGTIHPGAPVDQLAKEAAQYAKTKGVQVSLKIVGRCGIEQERWAAGWKSAGLGVELLGEQPPERISEVLGNASIGIATTAFALVEKSGSVAAMREHGLPVLCISRSWQPRGVDSLESPLGIMEYRNGNFEACLSDKLNLPFVYTVSDVSRQFMDTLLACHKENDL